MAKKIIFDEIELRRVVSRADGIPLNKTPTGDRLKQRVYDLLGSLSNW